MDNSSGAGSSSGGSSGSARPAFCRFCRAASPHPMFVCLLRAAPEPGVQDPSTFVTFSKNPAKVCCEQNREPGFDSGSKLTRDSAGRWRVELAVVVDYYKELVDDWRPKHGYDKRMVWVYENARLYCKDPSKELKFYVRDPGELIAKLQKQRSS